MGQRWEDLCTSLVPPILIHLIVVKVLVKRRLMAILYIAVYQPRHGNYKHWALCLEYNKNYTIFELKGEHPDFFKNKISAKPTGSQSHIANILVGSIRDHEVDEVSRAFEKARVDNVTLEWTCQDFVLEILETLRDQLVIDEDDEDYETGRKEAFDNHFGPM